MWLPDSVACISETDMRNDDESYAQFRCEPKRTIKLKNQQLYNHKIAISGNGAIVEITFYSAGAKSSQSSTRPTSIPLDGEAWSIIAAC